MRDIYNDDHLQYAAFEFAQSHFPQDTLNLLLGQDEDGNELPKQNIKSLLNQIGDFGKYTPEEWEQFFKEIRENGI